MSRLSVIIPCLNRHEMVGDCINSILNCSRDAEIEIVLVDDGSDPPLAPAVSDQVRAQDLVITQMNMGRASALRAGILACGAEFMMIMDSDDEMIKGEIDRILDDLDRLEPDLLGIVYETSEFDSGRVIGALPNIKSATLLALRADYGVKGDLKEIVKVDCVRSVLYPDPRPERRVPTSYLWAGLSYLGKVSVNARPVVRHRYLPGGMTNTIRKLKKESPRSLSATYLKVATAPRHAYRSILFRCSYALRAEAAWPGGLPRSERMQIRQELGWIFSLLAKVGGWVLRYFR